MGHFWNAKFAKLITEKTCIGVKETYSLIACRSIKINTIRLEVPSGRTITFAHPETVMGAEAFDVFVRALDIVLGDQAKQQEMVEGERIWAEVCLSQPLFVTVTRRTFYVSDEFGNDFRKDYLAQIAESEEERCIRHFHDYEQDAFPHKLMQYRMFAGDELIRFSQKTDGIGVKREFRSHLKKFIRAFQPEVLIKGKPFVFLLNKKGEFCVENLYHPGERVLLSECEAKIYRYLCYLHLSRFWGEIECIKNQNHFCLPLVINDFLDFIDESVDSDELIKRTLALNRQAFFSKHNFSPKN